MAPGPGNVPEIPQTFAIFDARISFDKVPMYQNAYAVYTVRMVAGTGANPIYVAEPKRFDITSPITFDHNPREASTIPIETRLELCHDFATDTSIPLTTYWWFTGTWLQIPFYGTAVPVIDLLDAASILKEPYYQLTASNDSDARFMERQSQQIQRYRMFSSHIQTRNMVRDTFEDLLRFMPQPQPPQASAPPPAKAKASTNGVPQFVADLLVKAAIEKKESCPISYLEFEQLSSISITKCYHCFDTDALAKWLKTKAECPLCKATVNESELTLLDR